MREPIAPTPMNAIVLIRPPRSFYRSYSCTLCGVQGERFVDEAQVGNELAEGHLLFLFVPQSQQRGWMEGGVHMPGERALDEAAAHRRDAKLGPEQGARGGGAQADDHARLHGADFPVDPLAAGFDLALRGRLVQASLAAQLPLEVLDRVGDVDAV